ncbi:hypothetical protein BBJ28_00016454 [Nothophytophthora sp. Chile5]|nr:hypothetical protein BBJ28_00016454 [Nothophytophthora sp. Chile5]
MLKRGAASARGFSQLAFPAPPPAPTRRVVVTGMGAVTPFGVGVQRSWEALLDSQCAVQTIDSLADTGLACTIGAAVPRGEGEHAFRTKDWANPKNFRSQEVDFIAFALAAGPLGAPGLLSRCMQSVQLMWTDSCVCWLLRGNVWSAADEAIKDSGWTPTSDEERERAGPNHACVTACATGSHSIGDASRFIRHGDADVMVAGGTESSINELSMCGFLRAQALSTKEYEHAKKRGARIYAEVRGYGLSGDSYHMTAPPENGDGARRAMQAALAQSGLSLSDVGYINAHATSTPLGDRAENTAVKELFGDYAHQLGMSSTKVVARSGAIGHLLGAAGAVEAIFAIKALQHNVMPPTINLAETTEEFTLNYVPNQPQEKELRAVLSNSFGFGGTNASLLFSK